jgi:hypothetical protein
VGSDMCANHPQATLKISQRNKEVDMSETLFKEVRYTLGGLPRARDRGGGRVTAHHALIGPMSSTW